MTLSVLIPVYQQDVRALVQELYAQLKRLPISFEICCLDDFSTEEIRKMNRTIREQGLPELRYAELAQNIGRSAIRNQLAKEAQADFLWFLDCDADAGVNANLSANFVERMKKGTLLSGGRIYQKDPPADPEKYLHWLWGSQRELLDPVKRMQDPVNHFLSNNFVIHKDDFQLVRFNTHLQGYGYEDTFFASELSRAGIRIEHIRNPVMHTGLEPVEQFLGKIKESLLNLHRLEQYCITNSIEFPVKSRLIRSYQLLKNPFIKPFARLFAGLFLPMLQQHLKSRHPRLMALDFYRLFIMIRTA